MAAPPGASSDAGGKKAAVRNMDRTVGRRRHPVERFSPLPENLPTHADGA
jgi:hypothetical protein